MYRTGGVESRRCYRPQSEQTADPAHPRTAPVGRTPHRRTMLTTPTPQPATPASLGHPTSARAPQRRSPELPGGASSRSVFARRRPLGSALSPARRTGRRSRSFCSQIARISKIADSAPWVTRVRFPDASVRSCIQSAVVERIAVTVQRDAHAPTSARHRRRRTTSTWRALRASTGRREGHNPSNSRSLLTRSSHAAASAASTTLC